MFYSRVLGGPYLPARLFALWGEERLSSGWAPLGQHTSVDSHEWQSLMAAGVPMAGLRSRLETAPAPAEFVRDADNSDVWLLWRSAVQKVSGDGPRPPERRGFVRLSLLAGVCPSTDGFELWVAPAQSWVPSTRSVTVYAPGFDVAAFLATAEHPQTLHFVR